MSLPTDLRSPPTAAGTGSSGELALVCRVRDRLCALAVGDVVETMRPLPIEGLAGMPAFVLGMSLIRGVVTPVVDAGALLGAAGDGAPARLVLVRAGARGVALAVEGVLGVRALAGGPLRDFPPLLGARSGQVVTEVGVLDAALLVVLRTARLVPDATWDTWDALPSRAVTM
jgi:purine-binding chemotaxis protein CheW